MPLHILYILYNIYYIIIIYYYIYIFTKPLTVGRRYALCALFVCIRQPLLYCRISLYLMGAGRAASVEGEE